jgi:urease subunit alpha
MGRVGESFTRLVQTAHKMKEVRGPLAGERPGDDNERLLRYLAKLTINSAITHGIDHLVGSLEPGKLADIVLWPVGFFGVRPELIVKGGAIAWAVMGNANASIPTVEPLLYRPMFGAHPSVIEETCLTFVSKAAAAAGVPAQIGLRRRIAAVEGCRDLSKADMVRNDALPRIEVDPETYTVRVDGEVATAPPAERLPLAQRYFLI